MTRELLKGIVRETTEQLGTLGYKKRAGEIYTCDLGEEYLGWIGLNRAVRDGVIAINPVVGVRCQGLERILANLCGAKPHGYTPPTVSSPLGYLMPEKAFRQWFFTTWDDLPKVREMIDALCDYGVPFITASASLAALQQHFSAMRNALGPGGIYRLPLVLAMNGERAAAEKLCDEFLAGMNHPATSEPYRRFAAALAAM